MFKRTAVVVLAVGAATGVLRGQQAPQQATPDPSDQAIFRAGIDYVEVDALVVDALNNPVTDLLRLFDRLPLAGLEPGVYVLHVEGRSRANEKHVASRDILLTIK